MNNLIPFYNNYFSQGPLNNRFYTVVHLDSEPYRFQGYLEHEGKNVNDDCPIRKELLPYILNVKTEVTYKENKLTIVWTIWFAKVENRDSYFYYNSYNT